MILHAHMNNANAPTLFILVHVPQNQRLRRHFQAFIIICLYVYRLAHTQKHNVWATMVNARSF